MGILETIRNPQDLSKLSEAQLDQLAAEIREFLISNVSQTGGHLGPNLGVVELTMAVHRIFDSPRDSIVFDTGHQSYVHKLLTGRQDFSTLRQQGGLSGYPDRAESEHDIVESSHASSSLSWADGISRARQLTGDGDRYVIAVVGDGALTGGMAWEAINNIAADKKRRVVIVVNDNGRSYAPTVGGFADYLASLRPTIDSLRTAPAYEGTLDWWKQKLQNGGPVGQFTYKSLHAMKKGIKDWWAPQGMFEDLGMKYIGPVDGHNLQAMEHALSTAKNYAGPVIVHAMTEKGHGYAPARAHEADQFHAVGIIDPETGEPTEAGGAKSWTSVFANEIADIADERQDIVGITGAMLIPVGLHKFAARHPERVFDVGIAEQHALTSAAGMAFGGLHPVVAIYATFLNRAFDQLLMDVALHKAGVTVVLDRAGVTGPDGASHHGMWDMAMVQIVPGLHLAAPRDATRLREELREAVAIEDAPTVVRFSKGTVGAEVEAIERLSDGVDVLARRPGRLHRERRADRQRGRHVRTRAGCFQPAGRAGHQLHRGGSPLGPAGPAVHHRPGRPAPPRDLHRRRRAGRRRRLADPPGDARRRRGHGAERSGTAGRVPGPRHPQPGAGAGRPHRAADHPRRRRAGSGHQGAVRPAPAGAGTPHHGQPAA